jgi:dephospho-CoA kinase
MKLIGLTGGIASGKSAVAAMLRGAGVPVVDADQLAREAVAPGTPALEAIRARFGEGVLLPDGSLDRKRLGALVFHDDEARAALNAIVHPGVAALAVERLEALRASGANVAVYEVPLLFESGLEGMMDATLLVALDEELQLSRLMARDRIDEAAARARVAAQMPLAAKRARATRVIENDGPLSDTARQLRAAWRDLTGDDTPFVA